MPNEPHVERETCLEWRRRRHSGDTTTDIAEEYERNRDTVSCHTVGECQHDESRMPVDPVPKEDTATASPVGTKARALEDIEGATDVESLDELDEFNTGTKA